MHNEETIFFDLLSIKFVRGEDKMANLLFPRVAITIFPFKKFLSTITSCMGRKEICNEEVLSDCKTGRKFFINLSICNGKLDGIYQVKLDGEINYFLFDEGRNVTYSHRINVRSGTLLIGDHFLQITCDKLVFWKISGNIVARYYYLNDFLFKIVIEDFYLRQKREEIYSIDMSLISSSVYSFENKLISITRCGDNLLTDDKTNYYPFSFFKDKETNKETNYAFQKDNDLLCRKGTSYQYISDLSNPILSQYVGLTSSFSSSSYIECYYSEEGLLVTLKVVVGGVPFKLIDL